MPPVRLLRSVRRIHHVPTRQLAAPLRRIDDRRRRPDRAPCDEEFLGVSYCSLRYGEQGTYPLCSVFLSSDDVDYGFPWSEGCTHLELLFGRRHVVFHCLTVG